MHHWIIGNPGTGKTEYLNRLALEAEGAVLFIGEPRFLSRFPKRRVNDVLLIENVGWNPLDMPASLIRDTIKALSNYTIATPVLDRVLYNSVVPLQNAGKKLTDLEQFLTDLSFRTKVLKDTKDDYIHRRWAYWNSLNERDYHQLIGSTENKAGEFTEDVSIREMLSKETSFDLKGHLFNKKVIVLDLPLSLGQGKISAIGSLFLAHVYSVVLNRHIHMPLHVFVDDFYLYDTPVLRTLLSHGQRFGVSVTLANQFLSQLSEPLKASVIGNCQKRTAYRLGIQDSRFLHQTIPENNTEPKLHELDRFQALVFDGRVQTEYHAPLPSGKTGRLQAIKEQSRRQFS